MADPTQLTVGLQGGQLKPLGSPLVAPIGVKAVSPAAKVAPPKTTLTPSQTAPQDFTSNYGLSKGTVYRKADNHAYSSDAEFKAETGYSSNNQKFDTAYKPPVNNQPASGQVQTASITPPPAATPAPPVVTPPASTAPYTPPNQGTTGVSQGGIVGNLIGNAQANPALDTARKNLQDLQNGYADITKNIQGSPFGLTEQGGQQGILNQAYNTKLAAAQTAVQNAISGQSNTTSGLSAAATANAPITNPQTGGLVSPTAPSTTGVTTSGASNLSSVVGTRLGADGKTTEYFNTQTGQGFSTPQELADFVNKQLPGSNANAQNVFQLLQQNQTSNQGGGALNPLNNITSIAQQVLSGAVSPSQAYAMGGTVQNWQGLLNSELQKQSGGSFDQSAAQAKYDANQAVQGSQAQQKAQFQSAQQQAKNLSTQFGDLVSKYNLNPSELNLANGVMQLIASNTSDPRYQALNNYVNDIAATYAQVLGTGGAATDFKTSIAQSFINQLASGASLPAVLASIDQQASAKIAGISTPSTTGNNTSPTGTAPGGFGWGG